MPVNLSTFSCPKFDRGASVLREAVWLLMRFILFEHCPLKLYALKTWVLRYFGAKVGHGVVIKSGVNITFPWKLTIGNHVWLGENCWLLNLDFITIEDNVCISQSAMLCTGSHNYKSPSFDLITQPIYVESGAWIATQAWVGPGVRIGSHAVLSAGSVTGKNLEPYGVYQGNPALEVRKRIVE